MRNVSGCFFCLLVGPILGVPDLAWYVSLVYIRLLKARHIHAECQKFCLRIMTQNHLEEHVEAPLVLGEGMARHLVDKALQPGPPVLDEVLLKDAFTASLRNP